MSVHPPPAASAASRRLRAVGAPLGVLIALGTVAGVLVIGLTAINPVGTAVGFVLSTAAMAVVVLAYLWLDRWEPEPPRLLVFAFVWGTSAAVVLSVALEALFARAVDPARSADTPAAISVALGAPVIEEFAKGLFLVVMMTGRRRHELNSATDCLVYAGLSAAGFAWLEDILYIANGATLGQALVTAAMRLVMAPFAHPLFTSMTALGVWAALQRRSRSARIGLVAAGYLAAVALHALWNGSSLLGARAYFGVYLLWMMPIFAVVVALAVHGRRREQQVVSATLPGMAAAGLIAPAETAWLGSLSARRAVVGAVARAGGPAAAGTVAAYAGAVVELAFVRDRIDRGFADDRSRDLLDRESASVRRARRAAAPALEWLGRWPAPGPR